MVVKQEKKREEERRREDTPLLININIYCKQVVFVFW